MNRARGDPDCVIHRLDDAHRPRQVPGHDNPPQVFLQPFDQLVDVLGSRRILLPISLGVGPEYIAPLSTVCPIGNRAAFLNSCQKRAVGRCLRCGQSSHLPVFLLFRLRAVHGKDGALVRIRWYRPVASKWNGRCDAQQTSALVRPISFSV